MALLDRLHNDRSLAVFSGQFVPLKLVTEGNNEQWATWSGRYRAQGNGIPILFVIRADGQQLYGKSGSLPGDKLPQMLFATLQQAGRVFNDAEVLLLESSVEAAEKAMAENDNRLAAEAIASLAQIGTLGQLESFSDLALRADKIVGQLVEHVHSRITDAQAKLADTQSGFEGVLSLVEIESIYSSFPQLRETINTALREVRKNKSWRGEIKPAEALIRARQFASNEKTRRRAEGAYKLVLSRYADSPASQLARKELSEIDPASVATPAGRALTTEDDIREMREWTDRTGKYTMLAKFLELKSGRVLLERADGKTAIVPIGRLSESDRQLVRGQ